MYVYWIENKFILNLIFVFYRSSISRVALGSQKEITKEEKVDDIFRGPILLFAAAETAPNSTSRD